MWNRWVSVGLCALAALGWRTALGAGPLAWEPWSPATWPALVKQLPRPAWVVFTAPTCAVCPGVMADVERILVQRAVQATQVVVWLDEPPAHQVAHTPLVARAARRFVLRGPEWQLRQRVNPDWRGELPYLALLDAQGGVHFVAGLPSAGDIEAWLAPAAAVADNPGEVRHNSVILGR